MKSAFHILKPIIGFLCVSVTLLVNGCTSPNTNIKRHHSADLKTVDKVAFLDITAGLSKNMSQNHASVSEVIKVLKRYSAAYKINFTGNSSPFSTITDYLDVYLLKDRRDTSKLFFISIVPPSSLQKQITFNDLKGKFGDWGNLPEYARPMDSPSIITTFNRAFPGISILVESSNAPESNDNRIEEIKLLASML